MEKVEWKESWIKLSQKRKNIVDIKVSLVIYNFEWLVSLSIAGDAFFFCTLTLNTHLLKTDVINPTYVLYRSSPTRFTPHGSQNRLPYAVPSVQHCILCLHSGWWVLYSSVDYLLRHHQRMSILYRNSRTRNITIITRSIRKRCSCYRATMWSQWRGKRWEIRLFNFLKDMIMR